MIFWEKYLRVILIELGLLVLNAVFGEKRIDIHSSTKASTSARNKKSDKELSEFSECFASVLYI